MTDDIRRYAYDVVVIGAGGSGLRAAIEARLRGKKTAIISKSLFGKAHTVMAEGGCAAAMGNVNPNDNWQVHFRDTMRGGKFLNNPRMAELHAKEAPDRVWELEAWGALFDRTPDGKISQRNFGGHEYPRLAHVGDRTGLEMIRTLQQKVVALQQAGRSRVRRPGGDDQGLRGDHDHPAGQGRRRRGVSPARSGTSGTPAGSSFFEAPAVVLATGGIGKTFKVTSNSWEYTGDGHALALLAGRDAAEHGVRAVPPHPHGLAAVGGRAAGHRVGARRRRGAAQLRGQAVHVRLRAGRVPRRCTRRPRRKPTAGMTTRPATGARPSCCPATRWPGRSAPRSRRAADHRTAASSSTSPPGCPPRRSCASCRRCTTSSWNWPTCDITKEPMEVGPAQHYVMGGIEVDADTGAALVPGLFAAGEVSGGMHGSNRLGGNSLSDLLVFGRRAGAGAADYLDGPRGTRPPVYGEDLAAAPDRGADPAGASRRREPVHGARRGPADDERPGRHHPPRGGDQDRARASWTSCASAPRRSARRAAAPTTRAGTWPWTCATSC